MSSGLGFTPAQCNGRLTALATAHTYMHTHTHAHTHARTHARTHAHQCAPHGRRSASATAHHARSSLSRLAATLRSLRETDRGGADGRLDEARLAEDRAVRQHSDFRGVGVVGSRRRQHLRQGNNTPRFPARAKLASLGGPCKHRQPMKGAGFTSIRPRDSRNSSRPISPARMT